jgi:hypothetical protein
LLHIQAQNPLRQTYCQYHSIFCVP